MTLYWEIQAITVQHPRFEWSEWICKRECIGRKGSTRKNFASLVYLVNLNYPHPEHMLDWSRYSFSPRGCLSESRNVTFIQRPLFWGLSFNFAFHGLTAIAGNNPQFLGEHQHHKTLRENSSNPRPVAAALIGRLHQMTSICNPNKVTSPPSRGCSRVVNSTRPSLVNSKFAPND